MQEETVKSTVGAAGVRVLASVERFSEITTGRSYFKFGKVLTNKDLPYKRLIENGRMI